MIKITQYLLLLFVSFATIVFTENDYKILYFNQTIDHFSFTNSEKFKQRYLYKDADFDKENGTILFYAGNEGDITAFWQNSGFIFEISVFLRGLIVFAEHRFYGESLPYGNKSFDSLENISTLRVQQALADYAILIGHLYRQFNISSHVPVITFGGSYGGILSAYLRIKYPKLVLGSISSSAPLLSIAGIGQRNFFFPHITKVYESTCADSAVSTIRQAFKDIDYNLCGIDNHILLNKDYVNIKTTNQIPKSLSSQLKLCNDELNCFQDYVQLFSWIRNAFTTLSMMNYPYATAFLTQLPAYPVKVSCELMEKAKTPIEGISQILDLVYNGTGKKLCYDLYKEYVICSDPTGCGLGNEGIAWDYQGCADFILPGGTDGKNDMFINLPYSLNDRDKYCRKHWNIQPHNEALKILFGGDNFNNTSNIIFVNGDLDPWMPGGVLRNVSSTIKSYMVQGGAHHLDLRASNSADPPSVKIVRQAILNDIQQWIATHYANLYI